MSATLRPCPACGRGVSTGAATCPQCGQPLNKKSLLTKDLGTPGAVYVLLILFGLALGVGGLLIGWIMLAVGAALLLYRLWR